MPQVGCDEADRTMPVLAIVPPDEARHPIASCLDVAEALGRPFRAVLAGPEQGFREGIVVTDPGAAVGGRDAKMLQCCLQGRVFHRASVIGMEHERARETAFGPEAHDDRRVLRAFAVIDLPADDLAAEDVHHEVEIEEHAGDRPGQPGDVPGPDLTGPGGAIARGRLTGHGRLGAATMMLLTLRAQNAVEAGLRGEVAALIRKTRDDLAWRQAREFLGMTHIQNGLALLVRQFVARRRTGRLRPLIGPYNALDRPAAIGSFTDPQLGT